MEPSQPKPKPQRPSDPRWRSLLIGAGAVALGAAFAATLAPLAASAFQTAGGGDKWTMVAAIAGLIAALAVWPIAWITGMQRAGRAERALIAVRRELSRAKRAAGTAGASRDQLDAASLSALAQARQNGHENAERVIRLFLETSPDAVDGLKGALEKGDADAAGRHARRLHEASQDVASVELPVLLADVEALARAGDIGGMHAAANEVSRAFEDLHLALKTLRARS